MNKSERKITITIQGLLDITKVIGGHEIQMEVPENCTVKRLFDILIDRWGEDIRRYIYEPDSGSLLGFMKFMVNGRSINLLDRLDTVLEESDIFLFFPPVGGG